MSGFLKLGKKAREKAEATSVSKDVKKVVRVEESGMLGLAAASKLLKNENVAKKKVKTIVKQTSGLQIIKLPKENISSKHITNPRHIDYVRSLTSVPNYCQEVEVEGGQQVDYKDVVEQPLSKAMAPASGEQYAQRWGRYTKFAKTNVFDALHPSVDNLCHYFSFLALQSQGYSVPAGARSALKHYFTLHNPLEPSHTDNPRLGLLMRGLKRMWARPVKKRKPKYLCCPK